MLLLRGQRRQRQELGGLPNRLFARELHKDKSYLYAGTLPLYPDGPEASAIHSLLKGGDKFVDV
jgi:hypothetical protein